MSSKNFHVNTDHLANLFITYCKSRNENLPVDAAYLTVSFLLLHPKWKIRLKKVTSTDEVQNFILECFDFWFGKTTAFNSTIKMQCLFYSKYLTKEQFKDQKNEVVMKNCKVFLQKLRNVYQNFTEDFSRMHADFVKFILINEGMDDKDDPSAYDEMMTAVNSVLPASEFPNFVASNKKNKLVIMNEVSSVASGICLFAWYNNKAGRFMFDVGKVMNETLPKISEDMHEEISSVKNTVDTLQIYLKEMIINSGDTPDLLQKKKELIMNTNYYQFIKLLKENIDEIAAETYRLDYKCMIAVKELTSVIKSGPFIKAEKAYPFYKDISLAWKNLQLEGYLLDFYANLFFELKEMYMNRITISDSKELDKFSVKELIFDAPEESSILVTEENVKNFSDVTLETHDFCAYYCSMGILIPFIKQLGIICLQNACYGFSSNEAMVYFQRQPNVCIELAKRYMKVMPELIITLGKEEHFGLPIINTLRKEKVSPVFISEKQVQTVLHCVEENMDYTYNWNQWSMRKEAVKFVDLMTKKTHSTQTDISHFRRESSSQVYLLKDNWTQTRKECSTSMSGGGVPELSQNLKNFTLKLGFKYGGTVIKIYSVI